jgi:hypothetical protein
MNPLHDYFVFLAMQMWRRRYAEERLHPEYVDFGGEA